MLPLLTLLGLNTVFAKPLEHKVIFFLDVSQSMCKHLGDDVKVDQLRTQAKTVLADSSEMGSVNVSFYKYGDMTLDAGEFVPNIRTMKENVSPQEGIQYIDEFFQYAGDNCRKDVYPDNWTYVASSVRYLLDKKLDLPSSLCDERWHRYNDEDNPVPNIILFGITDNGFESGGESTPCIEKTKGCVDDYKKHHPINEENIAWLSDRSALMTNFNYQYWNIDNDAGTQINVTSDDVYYRVKWSGPTTIDVPPVNLTDGKAKVEWEVNGTELPKIRMIPMIQNPQDKAKANYLAKHMLSESTHHVDHEHIGEEQDNQLDVVLNPHFDLENDAPQGRKNIGGLKLEAKARRTLNGHIVKEPLELAFTGSTTVRFESGSSDERDNLKAGETANHLLYINTDELAEVLSAQYPNASFIWSSQNADDRDDLYNCKTAESEGSNDAQKDVPFDETLPSLVRLPTERKDIPSKFNFYWKGTEESLGASVSIDFDHWGRAYWVNPNNQDDKTLLHQRPSSFVGKVAKNNGASVDFKDFTVAYSVVAVDAEGNSVAHGEFIDVDRFATDGTIVIPPVEGKIFDITQCLGFCWGGLFKPSGYEQTKFPVSITLTAQPTLTTEAFSEGAVVHVAGTQSKNSNSVTFEVHVEKMPLNYLQILIRSVSTILFIWFAWGWKTRPRFPEGWYLGNDSSLELRRRTNGIGDQLKSWKFNTFGPRWGVKPPIYYINFSRSIDNTVEWHSTIAPTNILSGVVIALSPTGHNKFRVWCAACPADYTLELEGDVEMIPIPPELLYNHKGKFNMSHPETGDDFGFAKLGVATLEDAKFILRDQKTKKSVTFTFTEA